MPPKSNNFKVLPQYIILSSQINFVQTDGLRHTD